MYIQVTRLNLRLCDLIFLSFFGHYWYCASRFSSGDGNNAAQKKTNENWIREQCNTYIILDECIWQDENSYAIHLFNSNKRSQNLSEWCERNHITACESESGSASAFLDHWCSVPVIQGMLIHDNIFGTLILPLESQLNLYIFSSPITC